MLKIIIRAAIMLIGAGLLDTALACECAISTPRERLERSTAVFIGSVQSVRSDTVSVTIGDRKRIFDLRRYTFNVRGVWKGDLGDKVEVTTDAMGSACGSEFDNNIDYVVYASERDGQLRTGLCSVNPPVDVAIFDLYSLGLPASRDPSLSITPVTVDDLFVIALTGDFRARYSALKALGRSEADRELIEKRLLEMLNGGDPSERMVAVEAFEHMGPDGKSAIGGLDMVYHSDDEELRLKAFDALISVSGRETFYPYMLTAINDDSYNLKVRGLREVSCMRGCISPAQQEELYHTLVELIQNPDEEIRKLAISSLSSCGGVSVGALDILDQIADSSAAYTIRKTAEFTASQIRREYKKDDG